MAVESRIDADDEWFVGEDRVIRFTVSGDTDGIENWIMVFELFPRRAAVGDPPLMTVEAVGIAATPTSPPLAVCTVDGDETTGVGPGLFQYVLSRTDVGARAVLGFGPAEIRSAVTA